jgi:hypothetical protein
MGYILYHSGRLSSPAYPETKQDISTGLHLEYLDDKDKKIKDKNGKVKR